MNEGCTLPFQISKESSGLKLILMHRKNYIMTCLIFCEKRKKDKEKETIVFELDACFIDQESRLSM